MAAAYMKFTWWVRLVLTFSSGNWCLAHHSRWILLSAYSTHQHVALWRNQRCFSYLRSIRRQGNLSLRSFAFFHRSCFRGRPLRWFGIGLGKWSSRTNCSKLCLMVYGGVCERSSRRAVYLHVKPDQNSFTLGTKSAYAGQYLIGPLHSKISYHTRYILRLAHPHTCRSSPS